MRLLSLIILAHVLLLKAEKTKKDVQNGNTLPVKDKTKKSVLDSSISLWNGRIIVSLEKKKDNEKKGESKNIKTCTTSTREVGICTRLSHCKGFKLSSLHNNICFMDIFVPGVCCVRSIELSEYIPVFPFVFHYDPPKDTDDNQVRSGKNKTVESLTKNYSNQLDNGCGIHTTPSSRIIHGTETPSGKWPWMAAIYTNTYRGQTFHCGGSLISSRHVLTGAHCVKDPRGRTFSPSQITVRLGDSDITTIDDNDEERGKFFRVESIAPHPKFQNINHYFMNDVAVLRLYEEVVFSDFMLPICLPPLSSESEPLDKFAGKLSTITGYGKNELGNPSRKLLEAEVPIWKNHECDSSYFAPITEIFICAGYRLGGMDACQGDSGGPLQIEIENRWTQIGITSFGKGCGEPGFPGVYARLGKFVRWIRENMG